MNCPRCGDAMFVDQYDTEKVSLEVLLDGLERLAKKQGCNEIGISCDFIPWYVTGVYDERNKPLADHKDFRTAIIAAIEKLLEVK